MKSFEKIVIGLTACACVLIPSIDVSAEDSEAVFREGVYLDDVSLGGLTVKQVDEEVEKKVEEAAAKTFTLNVDGHNVDVTGEELGIYSKNLEDVEDALHVGCNGDVISRYKELKDLEHTPVVYNVTLSVKRNAVKKVLEEKCSQYEQPAVDSTIKRVNGSFVIEDGRDGTVVDTNATIAGLQDFIENKWNGEDASYQVTLKEQKPRGSKEELSKVKDVLGSFSTSYGSSGSNRSGNVSNGTRLIDGSVLYPGEEFSVYEAVSPFTEENGYYMAGSYLNGQVVESFGGGICQVSTTLYNAVLRAELDVKERFNHSMIVNYVDPSADAAIAGTYKDLKFVNNTQAPIYIEGYTSSDKKIYFTIYGQETRDTANRKISFESKVIEEKKPSKYKITTDSSMKFGSYSNSSAHTGYVAELYKIVQENGVETQRSLVNKSVYQASPATLVVGTKGASAEAVKAIKSAAKSGNASKVKGVVSSYKKKAKEKEKEKEKKEETKEKTEDKDTSKTDKNKDKETSNKSDKKDKDTTNKSDSSNKKPTATKAPKKQTAKEEAVSADGV